jgi:hypothetical protein
MTGEKLSSERIVRLLRAKEGEYVGIFTQHMEAGVPLKVDESLAQSVSFLMADLALLFGVVADHIESGIQEIV